MAAFEYQALDARGRTHSGLMTADSARLVRQQLREQGLTPINVVPVREQRAEGGRWRRRISASELAVLTRQFATLVGAGLTIEDALRGLVEQSEVLPVRRVLTGVRSLVMEGSSLADAMEAFPGAFPGIFRAAVRAGEQSGRIGVVLERLADYTEATQGLRQRMALALIYPVILMVVSITIVAFLFTYVVPKVVQVFEDTGQTLPLLTRIFIAMSEFLQHYGIVLLAGMAAAAALLVWLLRQPGPRFALHRLSLRLPWSRRLVRAFNTTRMARTLAIMVGSGVPLLTAMQASSNVITNRVMRRAMERATEEVGEGISLNKALARSGLFPPILVQMVASGEASGRLDVMLDRSAAALERELETRVAVLVGLFEPLMILFMGGIVLVIVLAILLPIFDINQLLA